MSKAILFLNVVLFAVLTPLPNVIGATHELGTELTISVLDASALPIPVGMNERKPHWKSREEYDAFQAFVRESDPYNRIALIQVFIQKHPDSDFLANAYVAEMQTYIQLHQTESAIKSAENALKIDPNNLLALYYVSFTFPYTFKPSGPNAQAELSQAAQHARNGLQALQSMQKPAGASQAEYEKTVKADRATFNTTVGFVALQQKDYNQAIKSLEAATQDQPENSLIYSLLGQAYYNESPRDIDKVIWNLARATVLAVKSSSPNASELTKFYTRVYESQHGSTAGAQQVLAEAKSSATMPADFGVAPPALPSPSEHGPASNGTRGNADMHDFRNADWGMSESQVEATESGKPFHVEDSGGEHFVDYQRDIAGFSGTYVAYVFVENKLVRAKYIFSEQHTNDDEYISDFNQVKRLLTAKYGKPTDNAKNWKSDDDQQEFADHEGLAVATGTLSLITKWKTPSTRILEGLLGDNYEFNFQVEYDSLALEKLDNDAIQKAKESQF